MSNRKVLAANHRCDAPTLERIITDHVLPGIIIVSDTWGGHINVSTINNAVCNHQVVVHAQNFVHPVHNNVHIQTIKEMWMQAKRKLRYQSGTSHNLFPSYLAEFQWWPSHKEHVFGQYLTLLSDNYAV